MRALICRRLLVSVPLVLLVSMLTFLMEALVPGDTALTILGEEFTPEAYEQLRHQLGLDQPLAVRYWHWLLGVLQGDFGVSPVSGLDVGTQVRGRLAVTLCLIVGATVVAGVVGVALGVLGAVRGGALGRAVDVLSLAGFAVPVFWLGLVLVTVFAVGMGVLPATGYVPLGWAPDEWLRSLVLPVVTLALAPITVVAKQTRDGMLAALAAPYVHSLRANGASEASIVLRHAFRNAAVPVVTVTGLVFVGLLSGTVLVESVFAMPGLGGLVVQATTLHDLPLVQAVTVTFTAVVVVVNLLVDLAYGWLNPKVRVS